MFSLYEGVQKVIRILAQYDHKAIKVVTLHIGK